MLKRNAGATDDDTIVLVWGNNQDSVAGAAEIVIRAREATIGVPSETRQALRDGTNGFERILPGPDRMYPDTDLPPRRITGEHLTRVSRSVPRPFWENEAWYRSLNIPTDLALPLAFSPLSPVFEKAVNEWRLPPMLVAVTMIQFPKRISRRLRKPVGFTAGQMSPILEAYRDGALVRDGILPALTRVAMGATFSRDNLPSLCSPDELDRVVHECRTELSSVSLHDPEKQNEVLLGLVMTRLRGRVDGAAVAHKLSAPQEARR
jgi:glutamyl-tRNA(Gln) amidotransferase subunit E